MMAGNFGSGFKSDDDKLASTTAFQPSYPRQYHHSRPLVDSARNGWQLNPRPQHYDSSFASDGEDRPRWIHFAQSVASAPRFRRYVLVYLLMFIFGWLGWRLLLSPRLQERRVLLNSLNPTSKIRWFGANSMPQFKDLIQVGKLDPSLIPIDPTGMDAESRHRRRLIFVGDVHGCKEELEKLLKKVDFNHKRGDHLVFVGDLINKGPDSMGVVDIARQCSASSVRGNHEDRILLLRREMVKTNTLKVPDKAKESSYSTRELGERALARSLSDEHVQWLENCPIILDVGQIPGMGQVVVAHAGLVPEIELDKQDPVSVMTMRTIDLDTHVPSPKKKGMNWAKMFDKHQSLLFSRLELATENPLAKTMTVIYGHDSSASLSIRTFTKGLDSGCVDGGKLTALVIEGGGKQNLVQVSCPGYLKE